MFSTKLSDWEALYQEGNFQELIHTAEPILDGHDSEGHGWWLTGMARYRLGDFHSAARNLEHAGLWIPLNEDTQLALAECYLATQRPQLAGSFLSMLLENLERVSTMSLARMAANLGRVQNFVGALRVCRLATRREPEQPEGYFGMAFYMQRLGYPVSYILPWIRRAFELAPHVSLFRVTLGFLLAEAGRHEEAVDLLSDLSLEQVGCACQLRRLKTLFMQHGNYSRGQDCTRRLRELGLSTPGETT
jgi:tetratricopeptide (TPR) repeat protein